MSACINHVDRPAECPQAHVCECGAKLSDHVSIEFWCPPPALYRVERYKPNAATLAAFPEQYPQAVKA